MSNSIKKVIFIIALFMLSNVNTSDGFRILGLFPMPMNSMNVICEELMIGLAGKGHQVDVYSHFPPKKPIPNFTHFNLFGSVPAMTNNLTFELLTSVSMSESLRIWIQEYGETHCDLLEHPLVQKLIKNPPNSPPYDLIIVELSVAYCLMPLGRHLNAPVILVENSPLPPWHFEPFGTPLNLAVDSVLHLSYIPPMTFFERLNNLYTHHLLSYTFNRYLAEQDKYVEKYFGPGYPSVVELQKDVSLVLLNHDPALYGVRSFAPNIIPISGLHVVDRNETLPKVVKKWLDDSKDGFIFFSFGSMIRIETFPRHIIEAFYKSFEAIKPVRVLMKIAKPEELPPGLPSNVITQSWLSQIQVLKHKNIKAFVTHGGMMGTQEAIYYGVPMVGVPVFFDQHFNLKSYVQRKIAIKLNYDEVTDKTFTNALKEILHNPMYRENVQKIRDKSRDRPLSPMDTAAFWIEYVHRHGKDALRSPIVDMPWWQASLLDIYAFIIGSILTVLLIIFTTVKKLIKTKSSENISSKKKN